MTISKGVFYIVFATIISKCSGQTRESLGCLIKMPYNSTVYYNCCPANNYGYKPPRTYDVSYKYSEIIDEMNNIQKLNLVLKFIIFSYIYIKIASKSFREE